MEKPTAQCKIALFFLYIPEKARKLFDNWCEDAMKSKIHPLMKVAKTLMLYRFGLMNYFKHKISSGKQCGFKSHLSHQFRFFDKIFINSLTVEYLKNQKKRTREKGL